VGFFTSSGYLNNNIMIQYAPSSDNPAVILAEAVDTGKHQRCMQRMGFTEILRTMQEKEVFH